MTVDERSGRRQATDRLGLVLAKSGHIASVRIRKALAVTGLKPGHGHVLLWLSDSGPMSQQALIEALGVDPSVLVAILNDLERDGIAVRRRDPADRRRHIVEMSERGAALVDEVDAALTAVEQELFVDLDDGEIDLLRRLLARVRANADEDACAGEA
ncbi:MarR family winged helix-turn-helix transcriptional regulator [Actinomadura sp. HBU206391]|uniref:MarR family winged helix-turn-helix transcriptional regulator n=1 Tax=Actinomadura sp. HBU206391 TaxID=2731692 RepID=UPI00164F5EF7|nr:MarR family winged helix-turn-helix transcriptional regulator [Actinomadura sp. HBU206391]MBC6456709.1 winged helix-turn-helix transcriptional regulator [Actinomadura sp. HBU206391]